MPVDLSRVILDSNTPAFRNYQSGDFSIDFSGTLTVPGGSTPTTLTKTGSVDLPEEPALLNLFVSQSEVSASPTFAGQDYEAYEILRIPPYDTVYPPCSGGGFTEFPVSIYVDIFGDTLTVTLQATNAGGSGSALTFPSTIFRFRYVAYLPTQ